MAQTRAGRTESGGLFPKIRPLPGSLHHEFKRCGRAGCRCGQGQLHGPYWRRRWWNHGQQRRRYVRPADVAAVEAALTAWRELHPPVWRVRQLLAELRRQSAAWT